MTGNEVEVSDEENPEDELVEEISEEEDMDEYAHEGFLISDEYYSNDPDKDTEAESLI